ncbi:dsRBD fold-containing protein [Streptomyces vinaceus]|uniref:dsRBD fold-containing protein n=1 Tax=Streptomyces vinaceus TaxID=1960 RepID=UPI0038157DFD
MLLTHTAEWKVGVSLTEEGGTTRARAVLDTGAGQLVGRGSARCNPEDPEVAAMTRSRRAGP